MFRPGGARPPSEMRGRLIDAHRDAYGGEPICDMLAIAPSLYYARRGRQSAPERRPPRARRDERLSGQIQRVWHEEHEVYGVRKVWWHLRREGEPVARCPVERLMRPLGRHGVRRGRNVKRTTCPATAGVRPPARHAAVRGDATESPVGRGPAVRGDVAGLRVRRVRHRRLRPPDRGLARVELVEERPGP